MYITSIFCNLLFLLLQELSYNHEDVRTSLTGFLTSLFRGFDELVIGIVLLNALIGILTSLFIKTFNSVLKTFVSAIELILTAILSFVLFGIPVYWNTVVAIFIVSVAITIYAMNPIHRDDTNLDSRKKNSQRYSKGNSTGLAEIHPSAQKNKSLEKQIDEMA